MSNKKEDLTEKLNLSKIKFKHSAVYYDASVTNAVFRTPAGLWIDVLFNSDTNEYEVFLDRAKYQGQNQEINIHCMAELDALAAQCLLYDYWHRDADGNPPTEAT